MFELTKLLMSLAGMVFQSGVAGSLAEVAQWRWRDVRLFALPALAYLINDNLMFLMYAIIKVRGSSCCG